MPDITNPLLFAAAGEQLAAFRRSVGNYHGRFVQLFLAMKFFQNELPSMYSGQFVSTEVFQTLLDDLYAKASRELNDSVFMLFENSFLARTGTIGVGNKTSQNTWRNNLNLQKGIGCYAAPADLSSPTFLNQPRSECQYLDPNEGGGLAGGRCTWCPTGATYRNESHRKWLKIDPGGNGYAVLDLLNVSNFSPYVAPEGTKIPLLPLIIALYHDALPGLATARTVVEVADFASDFNFSAAEMQTYFDSSLNDRFNVALLNAFPEIRFEEVAERLAPNPLPRIGRVRDRIAANRPIPPPVLTGTPVAPPAVNTGWDGEQYVAGALRAADWAVWDVSRQKLGYDLLAKKGKQVRYIDVKSSLGMCSPTMTSREWSQANIHGALYVLAIIENFDPLQQATVYWVPDPTGRLAARESTQTLYTIARSAWTRAVVGLDAI